MSTVSNVSSAYVLRSVREKSGGLRLCLIWISWRNYGNKELFGPWIEDGYAGEASDDLGRPVYALEGAIFIAGAVVQ